MKSIYVDNDGNEWLNGGTYTDASLVTMANGETTQKAITDLQNRDINTFGTSDKWNGGSYSKGAYTIYNDTLYECIVAHSNVVPTNTTYWQKVSLAELSTVKSGTSSSNGLTLDWVVRGGVCHCYLHGIPTTTEDIYIYNIPKTRMSVNLIGFYWIDKTNSFFVGSAIGTTKVGIVNLTSTTNGIHFSFCYLVD